MGPPTSFSSDEKLNHVSFPLMWTFLVSSVKIDTHLATNPNTVASTQVRALIFVTFREESTQQRYERRTRRVILTHIRSEQ